MALKAVIKHTRVVMRERVSRRLRRRRSPGRPAASDLSVGADAIVLKACELLREVAPRELSLVKLAGYAAVDRSLIRYYFTDRSGLLLAAARHLFGVLRGRLDAVETHLAGDPAKRIREMAVALLEFQIEHPYFHRLMIDEVVHSPRAEAQAFFRTVTAQGVGSFREMAAETVRRGVARPHEGVFLYLAIIGICEFFVTGAPILRVAFGEDYDIAQINELYARFLREYVIDGIRKR
jgi:TetR/AcrR family transcriptional regulator